MRGELGLGFVQRPKRRARQLELPARLEGHGPAGAGLVGEADRPAVLQDALPSLALGQPVQQGADAAPAGSGVALVGDGGERVAVEGELLVLDADRLVRLAARRDPADEVVPPGDRHRVCGVAGHAVPSRLGPAPCAAGENGRPAEGIS